MDSCLFGLTFSQSQNGIRVWYSKSTSAHKNKTERLKPTMHEYLATCRSTDCARAGGGVVKRTGPGGGSRFEVRRYR